MLNDTVNEHVYTANKRESISEKTGDLNSRPKELRSEIMNHTLPRHRRKNNRHKDKRRKYNRNKCCVSHVKERKPNRCSDILKYRYRTDLKKYRLKYRHRPITSRLIDCQTAKCKLVGVIDDGSLMTVLQPTARHC